MVKTEDYLRELVVIFFIQKRIILCTTVVVTILAALIAFFWPPTYKAEGAILIKAKKVEKSPEALENMQVRLQEITREDLVSEVEMIMSPDVIEKTIEQVGRGGIYFSKADVTPPLLKQNILSLQKSLKTEILPESNIIQIGLQDLDPQRALTLLEELMNQYIQYRSGIYSPNEAETFYGRQAANFDSELKKKEQELIRLAKAYRTPDPQGEIGNNLILKKDLDIQLDQAKDQLMKARQDVHYLEKVVEKPELQFFSFITNASINRLGEQLQGLYMEKGKLLRVYDPESEVVKRIEEQIEKTFKTLKAEVATYTKSRAQEVEALENKVKTLEESLQSLVDRNLELHTHMIEAQRVNREMDLVKHSYETFYTRREEAAIDTSGGANSIFTIRVVRRPFFSGKAEFPKKRVVIPLGLLVGLITGFSLGYMREFFDHTFKRPEDVSRYAGLNTLFSISSWEPV
ncbi:MAG: hypothetical protein KKB20_29300 [Proteobacteria bacterium]|nr:hypothetical protein [Pseudomonadota bacterium]